MSDQAGGQVLFLHNVKKKILSGLVRKKSTPVHCNRKSQCSLSVISVMCEIQYTSVVDHFNIDND